MNVNSKEHPTQYYFAYGANMNPLKLKKRIGADIENLGHFVLKDYEFLYAKLKGTLVIPDNWDTCFATVKKSPGQTVHGVLYRFNSPIEQFRLLDEYEGVSYGFYQRTEARVESANTHAKMQTVAAQIYIGNIQREHDIPAEKYVQTCVEGAKANQVPHEHLIVLANEPTRFQIPEMDPSVKWMMKECFKAVKRATSYSLNYFLS